MILGNSLKTFGSSLRAFFPLYALLMVLGQVHVSSAVAQVPQNPFDPSEKKTAESVEAPLSATEIAERRTAIAEKLSTLRTRVKSLPEGDAEEGVQSFLERRIRLYEDLDLSYAQILDALAQRAVQEERKAELNSKKLSSELIPEEKPYQLSALRRVTNEVEQAEIHVERLKDELSILKQSIAQSEKQKSEKEKEKRKLQEQLEKNTSEDERQNIVREIEIISLEIDLANTNVSLYRVELNNAAFALSLGEEELARLQRIEVLIRADVSFEKSELEATIETIRSQETEVRKRLERAKRDLIVSDRKYRASRVSKDEKTSEGERARTKARQMAYENDRRVVTLLNKRIEYLSDQIPAWESIYDVYQEDVPLDVKRGHAAEAKDELEHLRRQTSLDAALLKELSAKQSLVTSEIEAARESNSPAFYWLKEQSKHIAGARAAFETYSTERRQLERLYEICVAEVDRQVGLIPVAAYYDSLSNSLQDFWNYELTSVDDRPITIRKVVTAFFIFALGVLISRHFTRRFFIRFLERFNVAEGSAAALQSLLFYFLVLIFALTALNVVNVPLTVFTFVGGAVAIGFGFGSQNVMNNFISGIIILVEQPVRRGDIVQIKSMTGIVTHIGLRSTSIKTPENIDIIVPNSTFLENEVVNWTLVDHRIRLTVEVGVAYGSPTVEVKTLLLQAVAEHEKVLSQPSPFVLFANFGADSLEFEVVFWSHIASVAQKRQVLSDIRFIIERLFRENGIVVAFPQRDIHMDTVRPLEVKILGQS